jgi:hypothetical protein
LDIFNGGLKRHRKGITIHPDNVKSGREMHVSIDRSAEISNTRARALICFGFTLFLIFSLWPTALFLSFPPSLTFFCLFCSAVLVSGVFACPLPFTTLNLRRRCKKLGSVWSRTKHRHTTEYNTESSVFFTTVVAYFFSVTKFGDTTVWCGNLWPPTNYSISCLPQLAWD